MVRHSCPIQAISKIVQNLLVQLTWAPIVCRYQERCTITVDHICFCESGNQWPHSCLQCWLAPWTEEAVRSGVEHPRLPTVLIPNDDISVFDWDRRSARREQPKDDMVPDRYLTKTAWICEIKWSIRDILETIDSNPQAERVFADEPPGDGIVVPGTIVVQAGFGVRLAGGVLEWICE